MMKIPNQPEQVRVATMLFGNTLRAAILNILSKAPATRAELCATLDVGEQSLARQIAMLEEHGVVETEILPGRGRPTRHSLNTHRLIEFETILTSYIHARGETPNA
ncbi:helix-turn-helix domain-containing protein [Curtobacterium sp. S6]|uniref:helix-turn-helix domain-containing protein n=1 Tax=Curtobacterium sp. S6 TaxID=1479623 RepID=UPI00128F1325|nr:winged helix-turn-helix domain-containing protein [Curtobacterium sp. S6]